MGISAALLLGALVESRLEAADPPAVGIEFFEKQIRPHLVQYCYDCHSAGKKIRGGLRLDSQSGWAEGGDSGAAVVPGKADESLLIEAIRYDGDLKMPPKGKLPEAVIKDFERWVAGGAPDPRKDAGPAVKSAGIDLEAGRRHWAYQLPKAVAPPVTQDAAWPRNDIDRFILANLEARGVKPVADADRATLARRLYFDLIGLPPTPEQIDEFVDDPSPEADVRLVDRLLASPHFGERWGRHWLDVVHFAESVTLRGFIFPEAWRYRDYVIETFNQDRPFDRFLREQISGDLLPAESLEDRRRNLVATTFLTLGNWNLEEQDKTQLVMDVVDDQLDTIGKAFLAQTFGCARCHDHKFDPIPTRDYYALAGILRNSKSLEHSNVSKWLEMPLPVEPAQEELFKRHETAIAELQRRIKSLSAASHPVLAAKDLPGILVDDVQAKKVGEWKLSQFSGRYIGDGYAHDLDNGKGEKSLTFQPDLPQSGKYEVRLAYVPGGNRSAEAPVTVFSADGEKTIKVNERETPPIDGRFISLGQFRFESNGQGFVIVSNEETKGHVIADAVQFIPVDNQNGQTTATAAKEVAAAKSPEVKQLEAELKKQTAAAPRRPLFMTVVEEKEIRDIPVHIRGSVHTLGDVVPRGFLQVATYGTPPAINTQESGRKELGEWLSRRDNPLPARVMANRVWHWLFGAGLVRTTDNFGHAGELPSHPELLDSLAIQFVEQNWSVKSLVRQIVLSRTYQLSSAPDAQGLAADPENRWLWRMSRRRLDAECLRDTVLQVSGDLQLDIGGPTIKAGTAADYGYQHADTRRSVYSPVLRNALPEFFEVFDFADPSMVTGCRNVSTVAPQALFLMNHPFVIQEARHAARKLLAESGLDEAARVVRAYRLTLGRSPSEGELALSRKHLQKLAEGGEANAEQAWGQFFQVLFASLDFRYLD
jgi:hypothetical protein